jgi:hypothetical protein
MSAPTGMGELSYGSFYLPAVAFGYLSTQSPTFITENLAVLNSGVRRGSQNLSRLVSG